MSEWKMNPVLTPFDPDAEEMQTPKDSLKKRKKGDTYSAMQSWADEARRELANSRVGLSRTADKEKVSE